MAKRKTGLTAAEAEIFELRLRRSARDLWGMLDRLYGERSDYAKFHDAMLAALRDAWAERPADLKRLDLERDLEPDWFQRPRMAGYVCYADRFAGDLKGLRKNLDYLEELGITYLHIMPCLTPRPGDSDGGYSVMDYRQIDPRLGTMKDFETLCRDARGRGISICIDLVLNHTAKEHSWAEAARAGDAKKEGYYLTFRSADQPSAFEEMLTEVFPENAPGNFTWYPDWGRWVWTTFNEHQWDLDWSNPWVFLEMTKIMLHLANRGAEVFRLDAVAFMWKRLGTRCQSEPEVHELLRALRAAARVAAPAVIHLEEAIVSPNEMLPYLGRGEHEGKEGNLAYHNSLMVQFWSALAARDTALMRHVLGSHFPPTLTGATYATYIRCHDDIGWAVTDEDAAAVGLSGPAHRAFLSDYYQGAFPGSFACGALFQVNEETGDKRISGSFASLAGLERASEVGDEAAERSSVERMLMGHALIAAWGGVPLIYMGDEIAMLNDWSFTENPEIAHDSRWVHRPFMDWKRAGRAKKGEGPEGLVWQGTRHILARRRATPELHAAVPISVVGVPEKGLFALRRAAPTGTMLCLFNFTEDWTGVSGAWAIGHGVRDIFDALSDAPVSLTNGDIALPPYARLWLR